MPEMLSRQVRASAQMAARWRARAHRLDVLLTTAAIVWLLVRFVVYVLRRSC